MLSLFRVTCYVVLLINSTGTHEPLSHSSTHQKPFATHLSTFVSKNAPLNLFPIKWFLKEKKALSFSLKIPATSEIKTSKLKGLIKEEETGELQCALISEGLQLTKEEEGGARNASQNKPLFCSQFLPSLLLYKCEALVLPAPKHSALLCTY